MSSIQMKDEKKPRCPQSSPRKLLKRLPSLLRYYAHSNRAPQTWSARWVKLKCMSTGVLITLSSFFLLSVVFTDTVPEIMLPFVASSNTSECERGGSEAIPRGFMAVTSDLALRTLNRQNEALLQRRMPRNLLVMAVGIEHKTVVDQIVKKFPLRYFAVMLFHYDGVVDKWSDLSWSNQTIHVVAMHQTKWWYAKRFLHPDIVEEYNHIFLWDEDLGIAHFDPIRYLKIMDDEGLQITQPAFDPLSAGAQHNFTLRRPKAKVHRRTVGGEGTLLCTVDNTGPPCTGWVELTAPVFSKAAWRCTWHMIQNDLVHGWGLDMKLGYCAQGLRSEKIGVIDAQYIVYKNLHSTKVALGSSKDVQKHAQNQLVTFAQRWEDAVKKDASWIDPYLDTTAGSLPFPA